MKDCLFDVSSSTKNFGIDENGLLTCSEKEFSKTRNPYVNVAVAAHDTNRLQAKLNIPNAVLEEIHSQPWYVEACSKGILNPEKYADSKFSVIALGGFAKDEVLKAVYIAQAIRFGEHPEYMIMLLKAQAEGNFKEVRNQIIEDVLKDMPKFEHPALQAYDPESAERMKRAQKAKYAEYIQAFNRRFYNVYSKIKDKNFSAVVDKNTLLTVMSERDLEFLETTAMQNKIKKHSAFDVNDFVLKALLKMSGR
jgi:hypothetical protein